MPNYSFEIKTPQDFFQALLEQYDEYKLEPLSSLKAILCAILCFHLKEWAAKAKPQIIDKDLLKNRISETGHETRFHLFFELCNGSKHLILTQIEEEKKIVSSSFQKTGDYYPGDYNNEDYDTSSCLQIELKDGEILNFEIELEKAIEFWKDLFEELNNE